VVNTQYEILTPTLKNISGHEDCKNNGADNSKLMSRRNCYGKPIIPLEYNTRNKREAIPENTIQQFRA